MIIRLGDLRSRKLHRQKAVAKRTLPAPQAQQQFKREGEVTEPKTTKETPICVDTESEPDAQVAQRATTSTATAAAPPPSRPVNPADPVVGGVGQVEQEGAAQPAERDWFAQRPTFKPPEFFEEYKLPLQSLATKDPIEIYSVTCRKTPWAGDSEVLDMTPVPAPKASLPKPTADSPGRPCWLRLPRKWLMKNFLIHLIGDSNIRYRGVTYCSICHHVSTQWDCHPLCWQCYIEYDLPLCGVDKEIKCPHCQIMGSKARAARKAKLLEVTRAKDITRKMRTYVSSGLPSNVYTQDDADWWEYAHDVKGAPNPDWLSPGAAPGSCFPYNLINPKDTLKQTVAAHPEWKNSGFAAEVKASNVRLSQKTGDVHTPSKRDGVYVPACLTWSAKVYSPDDADLSQPNWSMQQWAQRLKDKQGKTSSTSMSDVQCIKALAERLLPYIQPGEKKESGTSVDDVLASLHPYDLQKLLATGENSELKLSHEEVAKLTGEQSQELAKKCLDRMREQQRLLEEAKARVQSKRLEGERAVAPSPVEQRQAAPVGVLQLYAEKSVEFGPWTSGTQPELNIGWMQKTPQDLTIVQLCQQVRALGLNIDWEESKHRGADGAEEMHCTPKIEPHFLAEHWMVVAELQEAEPFQLCLPCPPEVAESQGALPVFDLRTTKVNPDNEGQLPKSEDVMPVTYAEADQLKRLSAAAAAFNNMSQVAARALSVKLEAVDTPLQPKREAERLLASLVREASTVANKAIVRFNALASAVLRRDAMLRAGRDPVSNPNMFGCPMTWQFNHSKHVGSY